MPNIVHIGLGKTATTTLQFSVFPLLCTMKGLEYNDLKIVHYAIKSALTDLSEAEQDTLQKALDRGNNFISNELLAHWDPAFWEAAAERNLCTFGPDTTILITLRESYSFIRSVYQQFVQGGNVVRPEFFFVDEEAYERSKKMRAELKVDYYCTDYLNYEDLVGFYSSRFAKVVCVDLRNIAKLDFLEDLVDLDETEKRQLIAAFDRAPKRNTSYSSSAMKLTFLRERVLKALGLKSLGSSDKRYEAMLQGYGDWIDRVVPVAYKNLPRRDQIIQFPKRAFKRIVAWLGLSSWRSFMQERLNLFVPNRRYELPIDDLRINRENMDKCNAFLDRLNAGTEARGAPETNPAPLRQN